MEMTRVSSSAINAVGYDQETQQMQIKFVQGRTYIFYRVPQHIFDGLLYAGSKGTYYNRHIRDKYDC
jgi:hypothetical protein